MSALVPFDYSGREVRTVMVDDAPWFVAADVAEVLGYTRTSDVTRFVDEDDLGTENLRGAGDDRPRPQAIISEYGLYAVLTSSRRPEAKPFRRWVTHEVLPTIRRTGAYVTPVVPVAPAVDSLHVLRAMVDELIEVRDTSARAEAVAIEAGRDAQLANARIDAIEGRHDWFAALGYAKSRGLATDEMSLNRLGRLASTIALAEGIEPVKVPHARFGAVNSYPAHIWAQSVERMGGSAS